MKSINTTIFIISCLMILPSWFLSFYYYPNENMLLKILHDSGDILYYPIATNFLELNFKPIYDLDFNESGVTGIVAYPILVVVILSLIWFFSGPFSIVIIQTLSVFISLKIFYNFSKNNSLESYSSLFISVFLLSFTFFLDYFTSLLQINFLHSINNNLNSFYNLRFPRPIVTNLFMFLYIYLCFKIFFKDKFNYKNLIFLGLISGVTSHIFHYFFIIQNILFSLLILNNSKKHFFRFIYKNKNYLFSYIFVILLFLILLFINSSFIDNDYYTRLGPVELNLEKKKILLEYYQSFLFNKFFILIFLLNSIIYYINIKSFKIQIFEYLNILFFSSIISPGIFFIISTKVITIYHFFNWIIIFGVINILLFLIFFFFKNINYNLKKKLIYIYIVISVIIVNLNLMLNQSKNDFLRIDRSGMIDLIIEQTNNKDNFSNKKFLVHDEKIFLWLVMNGFTNFDYIPQEMWTVRSSSRLESDMIKMFKFFNLNVGDFENYIKNIKTDFRMMNRNAYNFLGRKYYANKLKTFEDTDDFENYDFIKSIKPSISHSFAIPRYEIDRLLKKFNDEKKIIQPDYVLIDKKNYTFIKNFNNKGYCVLNKNSSFILYSFDSCD